MAEGVKITNARIDEVLHAMSTNGAGGETDRLLLVKEPYSCSARVTDAQYLGGHSKAAVRRVLEEAAIATTGEAG
jgi:hypothetical protein